MLNRHALVSGVLVVLAGLCLAVLVAWLFAATCTLPSQFTPTQLPVPESWPGHTPGWPPPEHASMIDSPGFTSISVRSGLERRMATRGADPSVTRYYLDAREAGWPLRCLRSQRANTLVMKTMTPFKTNVLYDGLPIPASLARDGLAERTLPLYPLWAGLAADGAIYAGVILALLLGLRVMRAVYRRRRGRCLACGYHVESLPACPECGEPAAPVHTKAAGT